MRATCAEGTVWPPRSFVGEQLARQEHALECAFTADDGVGADVLRSEVHDAVAQQSEKLRRLERLRPTVEWVRPGEGEQQFILA